MRKRSPKYLKDTMSASAAAADWTANLGGELRPRNFKLMDEIDAAMEKNHCPTLIEKKHQGLIIYGIKDDCDMLLSHWLATIVGIQGKQTGELIYTLDITIPANYPAVPPVVRFISPKIKMPCVNEQGLIALDQIKPAFAWSRKKNISDVLCAIRTNMEDDQVNKLSQALGSQSYS